MRIEAPHKRHSSTRGTAGIRAAVSAVASLAVVISALVSSPVAAEAAPDAADARTALTANASDFDPGLIISDDLFYDSGAMTASQIQAFLDSKIGACLNGNCLNVATIAYPGRAREVSSSTGNLICEAIPAGNIRASELIYRAQVACGISAKVILVTLQKEQSLVTKNAPSDTALRWAMGMACPDTAPCDTAFAGLGTQIVSGTRQLKAYKASAFARQPGTHYIQWHPDASCGGTNVRIQNYGTAALYNYTPYQPNAAALANLYLRGDDCSSYGNRNFWAFYNDWFGSSVHHDPLRSIEDRYAETGGASGPLGASVGALPNCNSASTSCTRTFEHGRITWKRGQGVFVVSGVLGDYVLAHPTLTGAPAGDQQAVTDPNGNGLAQKFDRGWLHSSSAGTFWSPSNVMTAYSEAGWLRGSLGWPVSEVACGGPADRCIQWFAGGAITGLATGTTAVVAKPLADVYRAAGGTSGELGFPVAAVQAVVDPNGNGSAWKLQNGWIHLSARGGFVSSNAIMAEYSKRGWLRGPLGWPIAAQECTSSGCEQRFAGGTIRLSADADMTDEKIAGLWRELGGAGGDLGTPLARPQNVTDPNGNGVAQQFERGWIHSSSAGVFATSSAAMAEYSRQGWVRGWLGWPTAAAVCDAGTCSQEFSAGTIVVAADGSARSMPAVSNAEIRSLHQSLGGNSGTLGAPVLAVQTVRDPNGNGFAQKFEKGWIHSSSLGTFATSTALMAAYSANGWLRGSLGWPKSAESCTADGCSQAFAGGTLFAPVAGTAFVVAPVTDSRIRALYDTLGGSSGALGFATKPMDTVQDPNGNGVAQRFERGWIHSSAAGTFWSPTSIMTAYSAGGWLRGPLGWPTADPSCGGASEACVQTFVGGTIVAASNGASVLPDAIAAAYRESGGPTGPWGYPVGGLQVITDPNGNGHALQLERGWVHSSAKGTYFSSNTVMTEYSARGWLRGSLGWPTSAETCDGAGCGQTFAGGTIRYLHGEPAAVVPAISNAAIREAWEATGGSTGSLGFPVGTTQAITDANGNGYAQRFERGWIHSSAAGTFATPSVIMTEYSARGWLRAPGGIGWPTSASTCDATACTQVFALATIRVSVGGLMTNSTIATVWQATGGVSGALGAPQAAPQAITDPNGNGVAQRFERGWIHSSAAGTYWTPTVVMTEYSAQGWLRGALGWPTADPRCLPGGCTQTFQGGTIDTR